MEQIQFVSETPPNSMETSTLETKSRRSSPFRKAEKDLPTLEQLRAAIPKHCFEPTLARSVYYLARDILVAGSLLYVTDRCVPLIESTYIRYSAWIAYGFVQGLVFTGIWVLGHDSGHHGFSKWQWLNDAVGLVVHSLLLTPYYAWRSTHRRHHAHANNMLKDHNYVPPRSGEVAESFAGFSVIRNSRLEEISEDAPIVTLLRIMVQQIFGWHWYLLTNVSASPTSLPAGKKASRIPLGNSHFAAGGALFRDDEFTGVLISDAALIVMAYLLYRLGVEYGIAKLMLLYLQPYCWLNSWIVSITYMHHTHPDLPKYDDEDWTFIKGSLATVDRNMGFIGKHFFHNIIETHVLHHLFSRIPQYHAEEASRAIVPLLGSAYHADNRPVYVGYWEAFTKCLWVEPEPEPERMGRDPTALWYKG